MTTGLLSIGSSALDAAYTALRTTGNNIANVNTPGYTRELTSFVAQVETGQGNMYIGTGVSVAAVSRVYSDFLAQQTNLAQSQSSQADTTAQLTNQINNMFSDSTTGLGSAIDNFFTQLQALAGQPDSAATRQTTLSAAQEMAGQFNNAYAQLQTMSQSTSQQIGQQVASVNTLVGQIAGLNHQIELATAGGAQPNQLLDQRNQDILTLNQSIGVTTNSQGDGSVNVYLANGQPLVVGTQTYTLATGQDPNNPQNVIVGTLSGNTLVALQGGNTGGGAIGALLQFQNTTIPSVEDQIGRLAVTLSSQMNALQAQGTDQNGNAGTAFFSTPSITVTAATTNTDSVTPTVSYSDVTQLQASDYQLSVQGGAYTLTRLSDGTKTTLSSLPATVDGMTINFSSPPANGDVFTIQPVRQGAEGLSLALSSGSQIAAASPMQASLGASNAGSLVVGNLGLQALPATLTQTPVTLTFSSPTQYSYVSGGSTVTGTYTAGQPIDVNGWSLTLTGTPSANDTVTVAPGASGTGDNRNAVQMTQLQGQPIVSGSTLDGAYSAVVANVGAISSTAQTDQTSKDAILQNATSAQSSVSGVNLDEEAAALMQYQQQYQAAAKLIQTATNVFDAILAVAGAA